jgi:hypothetical protein
VNHAITAWKQASQDGRNSIRVVGSGLEWAEAEQFFERPAVTPVLAEPAEPVEVGLAHEPSKREMFPGFVISDTVEEIGREFDTFGQSFKANEWVHEHTPFNS